MRAKHRGERRERFVHCVCAGCYRGQSSPSARHLVRVAPEGGGREQGRAARPRHRVAEAEERNAEDDAQEEERRLAVAVVVVVAAAAEAEAAKPLATVRVVPRKQGLLAENREHLLLNRLVIDDRHPELRGEALVALVVEAGDLVARARRRRLVDDDVQAHRARREAEAQIVDVDALEPC